MKKRALIITICIALFSVSYIFAIDLYDTMPNKISYLFEQVALSNIEMTEVGIELSGIRYKDELDQDTIEYQNDSMVRALAHEKECSKLCQIDHCNLVSTKLQKDTNGIQIRSYDNEENGTYIFTIKNQKDIHYNTYYDLKITGIKDIMQLDNLRNRGREQFNRWHIQPKESIYFKGCIAGVLSKQKEEVIVRLIMNQLNAKSIDYYEDDLVGSTCAYYGYTNKVDDYIEEPDGTMLNMQVSFNYNDEKDETDIVIAFPFYNTPF